jgi:hypothetical protein
VLSISGTPIARVSAKELEALIAEGIVGDPERLN